MKIRLIISLLALLPAFYSSAAEPNFLEQVLITSERNSADLKLNQVIYLGNVHVTQGSMKMAADKLTVSNITRQGPETLLAEGKPAKFNQVLENGQAMQAQANSIVYQVSSRELVLKGDAQISQQDSLIQGEEIRYNLDKQQLQVEGGKQGVTSIFMPQQVQQQLDKQKDEQ